MGIERDAVGLFLAFILLIVVGYLIGGLVLLKNYPRKSKMLFIESDIALLAAFFFLFNCYFHFEPVDIISNMTFGIGLFLISWAVYIVLILSLISQMRKEVENNDHKGSIVEEHTN